jgi:hypothetical protein
MSQNDVLHIEANFRDWRAKRGSGLNDIEPFLYYSLDHILKPYNLSDEDIRYGITDGGNDGGIDAIYLLANRNILIRDDMDLKASGTFKVRILIVQVKSSLSETGFKPEDVRKFISFTNDFLDLATPSQNYRHKYHNHLITIMQTFKDKYLEIAGHFPEIALDYYLVTRGDETQVEQAVQDEIDNLRGAVGSHLNHASHAFNAINTQSLLEYVRKRKQTTKTIKWAGQPLATDDGYVGLVKLPDYVEFLKDDDGGLNEMIFESNVRGYQGSTNINKAMAKSLADRGPVNFWLLNNGVTIVTGGKAQPTSPLQISIEDPQVVNGLQTSRQIFDYFQTGSGLPEERTVLIKVLPVLDTAHRDSIIQATNSQNAMSAGALRATDYVHNQIEDLFKTYGLYYDRRKGFYRDQGAPAAAIVSVTELVQALVAILQARPDTARARPSEYINKDVEYRKLFGKDKVPLGAYYKCIDIVRKIDDVLRSSDIDKGDQRNIKFYVSYMLSAELTQRIHPNADEVLAIDSSVVNNHTISSALTKVRAVYVRLSQTEPPDGVAKGPELLKVLKEYLSTRYSDARSPSHRTTRKRKPRDIIATGTLLG